MRLMLLSLVIFAFASVPAVAQPAASDATLMAALTAYDKAWNKKDVKAAGIMMADQYVYFNSRGGEPQNKQAMLEFLARPDYKLTFVERSEIVVFLSGNTAVVSSRWVGKGSWSGGTIDDDQRCGLVFVKNGKSWKVLAEHCTQIVRK